MCESREWGCSEGDRLKERKTKTKLSWELQFVTVCETKKCSERGAEAEKTWESTCDCS